MIKASLYKKVKATLRLTPHGLIKQYRLRKAADLVFHNFFVVLFLYSIGDSPAVRLKREFKDNVTFPCLC
jgi:hypothetical protein